jgi:son of sevenless-like protein
MATAVYAQQSFPAGTSTTMTTNTVSAVPEEQYITTFFCRALYDYQTQDSSSLSFNRNDVIEVLTRLESGWWDGLLGDERGWFPSNYVTVISDEEAEAILSGSAYPMQQLPTSDSIADGSSSTVTAGRSAVNGGEWHDGDISQLDSRNMLAELANTALEVDGLPTSDFWMPQVTAEGAVSTRSACREGPKF